MSVLDSPFSYMGNVLYCEDVEVSAIAGQVGTPCFIYSRNGIVDRFQQYDTALSGVDHRICYAVKANANLSVLRELVEAGAGFDIVSAGELYRVLQAGGDPSAVIFAGVGKTRDEIEYALEKGIHSFNCESEAEIALISSLAVRLGHTASIAVRVNPDVDAATHPYISTGLRDHKFGIDVEGVEGVYTRAAALPNLRVEGVACHIGSQLLDTSPLIEAANRMLQLVDRLRGLGLPIRYLDLGGGIGVPYKPEDPRPDVAGFLSQIRSLVAGHNLKLFFEPGRSIVAESGILLSRVLYRKSSPRKEFLVVDAAMNDLIRPALYNAHHEVLPVRQTKLGNMVADVVGPVCESGDFLARERSIPQLFPGDLVAIMTSGAYASVAASNYNARVRPPEILVNGRSWKVVRRRETWEDLVRHEL